MISSRIASQTSGSLKKDVTLIRMVLKSAANSSWWTWR